MNQSEFFYFTESLKDLVNFAKDNPPEHHNEQHVKWCEKTLLGVNQLVDTFSIVDANEDIGVPELVLSDMERTGKDRIYITANDVFDIQITKTDEGIVTDIYSKDGEEPLGSTWVLDSEVDNSVLS